MYKNIFRKIFFLIIISFTAVSIFADSSGNSTVNIFSKSNIRWMNKSKVKSGKYGFVPYSTESCAEMWFQSTPGVKNYYICSFKSFNVKGFDFLEISYKTSPGTCMVIDSWWDKGKMKRLARSVTSGNEWKTLSVPVRGKQVRAGLCDKKYIQR